jgi:hypothetical protein
MFILDLDGSKSLFDLIYFMSFIIFGMFIDTFHTHNFFLLLTIEHDILMMNMTLCNNILIIRMRIIIIFIHFFLLVASFTCSL